MDWNPNPISYTECVTHLPCGITHWDPPPETSDWTHPALTPTRQAGTRFTYPGRMEGWVDLGDWFTRPQTVTHPSTNPAVHGRDSNSQPVDHESNALSTAPPNHRSCWPMCRVAVSWCSPATKIQCGLPVSDCQRWSDVPSLSRPTRVCLRQHWIGLTSLLRDRNYGS